MILCAGGASELWNWSPAGVSEVVNDLHGYLCNFFRVLQSPKLAKALLQRLALTPFSRSEFSEAAGRMEESFRRAPPEAFKPKSPCLETAADFFIWNRQSMSGRMDGFSPLTKTRTRGGRNAEVNSWFGAVDGLPEVIERLSAVVIEQDFDYKVLTRENAEGTLFYWDPPYIVNPEAGRTTADVYHCEGPTEDHERMLKLVTSPKFCSRMMISGYRTALYDDYLTAERGWNRSEKAIDNKAQKAKAKKPMLEQLWRNFA